MTTIQIRSLDSRSVEVPMAQLNELFGNALVLPHMPAWGAATFCWNGMAASIPALVIQPSSAAEVARVVNFVRERELLFSIRGGGHNIAGTSVVEGGIVIDMGRMRSVTLDTERRFAHVGPGCLLGDVDEATQEHGLATALGFVSETGVAGLTLGGGFGYLTRRFGWTVDNLHEVEIVTADGNVRVANAEDHADLFWALRGGGGNFGVVTRFTFRLHSIGPMVVGGLTIWSADQADEILGAYRDLTVRAPRELTAAAIMRIALPAPFIPQPAHGERIISVMVCYSGDDPEGALAPLRSVGKPIASTVQKLPYVNLQSMLNAMEPRGFHRYWKTEFLPGLSDGFLRNFRDGALAVPSPLSQSVIFHLEGALNERASDDGAVGNRDARFVAGFSGTWLPGMPGRPHIDWVRQSWEMIREYSTGGNYLNFQLAEDDTDRLRAAYGSNFARLQQIKAEYDSANLFRVNRNIAPSLSTT